MAGPFYPAPDLGSFYRGNMAPPVRGPNGTIVQAPQFSQPGDLQSVLNAIYGTGQQAQSSPGLTSHSVRSVEVDTRGNPVIPPPPGYGGFDFGQGSTRDEQRIARAAYPQLPQLPGPNGYTVAGKDQSQLPQAPAGNLFAYDMPPQPPALGAIDTALGQRWGWGQMPMPPAVPGGVDWSKMAPDGLRPDGTYGGPQTGFTPDPANITVNGGTTPRPPMPVVPRPRPSVPQGPGANGRPGAGTIRNNPTKYGRTQQDRNDYANARQAFLASWNSA